jgi:glycerol-3-phosphate acyltransferase PlsY
MPDFSGLGPAFALGLAVLGYVTGSIPFGLLLTRFAGLGDVRAIGSGNIGATNVLRTGSKTIAALTLLCDILKGAVPALIGLKVAGEAGGLVAGLAAFLGHDFPVWLRFQGGKGVATYLGVLFALAWPLALLFLAIWVGLALAFRFSSVSSLAACFAMPLAAYLAGQPGLVAAFAVVALIVLAKHRGNIERLRRGEESRISLSGKG